MKLNSKQAGPLGDNFKIGLEFFSDFKSGQLKSYILKQGLSFPNWFQIRTSGKKTYIHLRFSSPFLWKYPKCPFFLPLLQPLLPIHPPNQMHPTHSIPTHLPYPSKHPDHLPSIAFIIQRIRLGAAVFNLCKRHWRACWGQVDGTVDFHSVGFSQAHCKPPQKAPAISI